MKVSNFKDFMKKDDFLKDTVNELELERIYNYQMYPRDSKIYSDRRFVNIDAGSVNGTHWVCFIVKDSESYYFDPFGGTLDQFLLKQLPKPII